MTAKKLIIAVLLIILLIASAAMAASIVGSKHDLSAVWTKGAGHSAIMNNYGEVCVYCHTPHGANTDAGAPLWNKSTPTSSYTLYSSATMDTTPSQPSGVSLVCMSCHDGIAAPDRIINAPGSGANLSGPWYGRSAAGSGHWVMKSGGSHGTCSLCHDGYPASNRLGAYIGTDLRNDHPVSMGYPTVAQDPAFSTPPHLQKGWSDVPLYSGKVECPTCHNVHDPSKTPFLRIANTGSALCYKCHNK
jgi:predicted CXXCH cytochrome family protein